MASFVELHVYRIHALRCVRKKLSISQIETIIQLKEAFHLVILSIWLITLSCQLILRFYPFLDFPHLLVAQFYIFSFLIATKFLAWYLIQMPQLCPVLSLIWPFAMPSLHFNLLLCLLQVFVFTYLLLSSQNFLRIPVI